VRAELGQTQGNLVAVVVTYNRLPQLQITVDHLLNSAPEHLHAVVIVDNASTDDTAAWLASQNDPRLHIHRSETNSGGAGGFETGMRIAMDAFDPDWLVLMDDDGRPQTGALQTFHTLDLTDWDAIAAAVYDDKGEICDMNCPSRNPFWNLKVFLRTSLRLGGRSGFHLAPSDYAGTRPVAIDITSFVGFFIRGSAVRQNGYPDASLFVYGDDALYTLSLRKTGGKIAFHPQIKFEHAFQTFQNEDRRFRPLWKLYYYHRNLLLLYRAASGPLFGLVLLVFLPKWALKVRHHSGETRAFTRYMRRAIFHGLMRRTNVPHATVLSWSKDP
jgi:GT2 family glycosyltransferase